MFILFIFLLDLSNYCLIIKTNISINYTGMFEILIYSEQNLQFNLNYFELNNRYLSFN